MKPVAHHILKVSAWLLLVLVAGWAGASWAAERSFVVVSLIGDKLEIVVPKATTGSHLDRNLRETIADARGGMDTVTQRLAAAAIERAAPGARVVAVTVPPSPLHDRQDRFFEGDNVVLPGSLVDALVSTKATHLLLVTKRRDEARAPFLTGMVGTGYLQGLGFYVDPELAIVRGETGEQVKGFIAPYAYLRLSLIDISSGKVLGQQAVVKMTTVPVTQDPNITTPWDVLTPAQKIAELERLLRSELNQKVAVLLSR